MALTSDENVTYQQHENGIHELIYRRSSRAAVDSFFSYIQHWADAGTPDDLFCILNDLRHTGHQPLNYYFRRLREINTAYPTKTRPHARVALVYNDGPLISTIDTFVRLLNPARVRIRIFADSRYDDAVQWLLNERQQFLEDRL